MTEYLLYQERFTGPIYNATDPYGNPINEITTTDGWTPFWREGDGYHRPEMHVIDSSVNPNYAEPVLRVNDAGRGIKAFKPWGKLDCGYHKQFVVPAGLEEIGVKLTGHAWYSQGNDATKSEYKCTTDPSGFCPCDDGMRLWIGVDPDGGDDPWLDRVLWHSVVFFDGHQTATLNLDTAVISDFMTVFIRTDNDHQFLHVDAYFAAVDIIGYLDDAPEPPAECRGLPRTQYERTYHVIPGGATEARRREIAEIAVVQRQQTCGPSYDDAGVGDLDEKTAVLWDISDSERPLFREFYATYYPGVAVEFDGTGGPLIPPEPPPTGSEPQYELWSDNLIGLHSGFVDRETWNYIDHSKTTTQKFFAAGDCWQAKRLAPQCLTVWRRYVGNEEGRIDEKPTIRESARWYLDQYSAEIETARKNMGLTVSELLYGIDFIESLNETIPTFSPGQLQRAVEFDVCFAEEVQARYGGALQTVVLNGAIGNPHESEVHYLIPAARAAYDLGGAIGYHAYWTANEDRSFLGSPDHWPYHAGRWMEWDKVFRAEGIYPRYVATEGGVVYAHDGVSFNSGLGWRSCGSFERYIADIAEYNRRVLAWNAEHGNRCFGLHIFAYGQWGWDNFLLGHGEVRLLIDWSKTL